MYSLPWRGGHGPTRRELTATVPAAGGAPSAVAAAERAGAQRSPRGRAVRSCGPAPEPGLLPPALAARRWPGVGAPQRRGRPRQLLRPGSRALWRAACERRRRAAPGPCSDRAPTRIAQAWLRVGPGAVPVHGEQRAFADGRGSLRAVV